MFLQAAAPLPAGAATLLREEGRPLIFAEDAGQRQPKFFPGVVLVQFKQTPLGIKTSAAQADRPLPGLSLQQLVGEHMATPIGGGGASSGGATTSAAGPSLALPSDAVMLFKITDGKSVEAKVAELQANPGGRVGRLAGGRPGGWMVDNRPGSGGSGAANQRFALLPAVLQCCRRGDSIEPQQSQPTLHSFHAALLTAPYLSTSPPLPLAPALPCTATVVDVAQPNHRYTLSYKKPDDEMFNPGPYSSGQWHLPAIQAPAAWGLSTGSQDVSRGGGGGGGEQLRCHHCGRHAARAASWGAACRGRGGQSGQIPCLWPITTANNASGD